MAQRETYLTIGHESPAEFKDRGSRFIAYAFPVATTDDFKRRLRELKKEHHKAVHHCFAYRIGFGGEQYRAGDDGEPAGTAGLPILGQIDSRKLTFTAIIVVRYFGGTLLGKPGLINAYKSAAYMALETNEAVEKTICVSFSLVFDYTRLDGVMQVIRQLSCTLQERQVELFCKMVVSVPISRAADFQKLIGEMDGIEIIN